MKSKQLSEYLSEWIEDQKEYINNLKGEDLNYLLEDFQRIIIEYFSRK